jgi:large subunit ribosomal protein L23
MQLENIIARPIVTEKSSAMKAEANKVVFNVDRHANKIEIRQAVEKLFSVKVVEVNTMVFRGKQKRVGRSVGRKQNWKKAVVTLAQGTDLDVFGPQTTEAAPDAG